MKIQNKLNEIQKIRFSYTKELFDQCCVKDFKPDKIKKYSRLIITEWSFKPLEIKELPDGYRNPTEFLNKDKFELLSF